MAKLQALGDRAASGVVAGSAGNHAQAVALAARHCGVPCETSCRPTPPRRRCAQPSATAPACTSSATVSTRRVGAAQEHARERGTSFVHPFDDADVVAGLATLGLELLEDCPDLRRVVVPVGEDAIAGAMAALLVELPGG